jgi:antirestriction protein ArdC
VPRSTRTMLSDSQRAERRRADREFARQAVEQLRSTGGWQRWLAGRRHFHRYSLANQLLIAMQRPEATRVAGFRAWLRLGYCVRKGERAIRIWVPIPPSKRRLQEWRDAGGDAAQRPRTHFRLGPVFDRSQVTELPPPAEPMPLDPPIHEVSGDDLSWALEPLTGLAGGLGCSVAYEAMPADHGGYYRPADQAIRLAEGKAPNHSVHTLIHELAHALVAAERRDAESDEPVALDYAQEELVVESVTYTVAGALGLAVDDYAIPYLASWSEDTDLAVIEDAAELIDRLAKRIEDTVLPLALDASTASEPEHDAASVTA